MNRTMAVITSFWGEGLLKYHVTMLSRSLGNDGLPLFTTGYPPDVL